jgi:hypothetical protein
MLSHEFIKQALDIVSSLRKDSDSEVVQPNRAVLVQIDPEHEDMTDKKTMVAPLQQKLELLKKAVDVSSYYDEDEPGFDPGPEEGHKTVEELEEIKRLAGVMHNAGDDNDVLDA